MYLKEDLNKVFFKLFFTTKKVYKRTSVTCNILFFSNYTFTKRNKETTTMFSLSLSVCTLTLNISLALIVFFIFGKPI